MIRGIFNVIKDPSLRKSWRFLAFCRLAKWLDPDYRLHRPELAWCDDGQFNDYLRRFNELDGMNTQRRWALWQMIRLVADIPGDTAECGVFAGASSYLICRSSENSSHTRTHFLFDSFEGLSAPSAVDGNYWKKGGLACNLETAKKNLGSFTNTSWHKGWIPETFDEVAQRSFAFVHIDVDLYQPTRDSIRFFYPRMNKGGIIVCDDYGFRSCPGATLAVDEFLAGKPEKMLSLPDGGGFLIRGCTTAETPALSPHNPPQHKLV